ncbi:5'/3'-nucleotidase SurE [Paenibacillus tengchongensis]|uniref:5'/3'-nucleotidase SurE n=1 Tax=Paenibacillus tengchongensis TaxID=2608684 RepID=UPI00124D4281|nr:5'/3'-nucleotidase SurE [Paenibacillus tengchongensis]
MNIVLINDDGYNSAVIQQQRTFLLSKGHSVFCFFPYENCSAYSFRFSAGKQIDVKKAAENLFIVSGSPIDCLHVAIEYMKEIDKSIDLVISGMNFGLNYGTTTSYSATVAVALELELYKIKGISVSAHESICKRTGFLNESFSILEKILWYSHENHLIEGILNVNFFERCTNEEEIYAVYENEKANFDYILPSVKMAVNEKRLTANISYNKEDSKEFYNRIMLGTISRKNGYTTKNRSWIESLCKTIEIPLE